jgi:hypothetical protein
MELSIGTMNGVEDNSISEIPTRGGGLDAHRPPLNSKTAISRRMFSMPPIHRVSMAPSAIDRRPLRRLWRRLFTSQKRGDREGTRREQGGGAQAEWRKAATKRRAFWRGW